MRILITGGGGLLGGALVRFLRQKEHVVACVQRRHPKDKMYWDPLCPIKDDVSYDGWDVVVHLAGENLAQGRWSHKKKEKIYQSRVQGTRYLVSLLDQQPNPPKVFICASAVGYYGSSEEPVSEKAPVGNGFLSVVCRDWEEAAYTWKKARPRIAIMRLGSILSLDGGLLRKILPLFRLGLGGKMGTGQQKLSWISLEDAVRALYHILVKDTMLGPVNVVSPHVVTQEEFARSLAAHLRKPCIAHFPAFLLQMSEKMRALVLSSIAVRPQKLQESGFVFRHPTLEHMWNSLFM